jgi:hypothetical protein
MTPTTIPELLQQIMDGRETPNAVDMMLVQLITKPGDQATEKMFGQDNTMREMKGLIHEALQGDAEGRTKATSAVLAMREVVAADGRKDREERIRQSGVLLNKLDRAKYPFTWAQTHLELGTALAAKSQSTGSQTANLAKAIESLNQALTVLTERVSPKSCWLAHYNLALAHHQLWEAQDEWDEPDDGHKQAAKHHATAALALTDAGAKPGTRLTLTKMLIQLMFSDGEQQFYSPETRAVVADLLEKLLDSPDAKLLDPEELEQYRAIVATRRKR